MANFFDDVIEETSVKPPIAVLKELAQELAKKTQGLLVGKVEQSNLSNEFSLEFYITAPSLNNYSYEVFSVNHDLDFYPLELTITATRLPDRSYAVEKVENQEKFEEKLKIIFSSPEVKKVINGLLAQIKSA
ncbi:MAG: hypothetical protein WCS87_03865 [Methylococcaceae bacterium]